MFAKRGPKRYKTLPERGRGGSAWAQTLSKRRPEAQDHFPSPPGPKKQIKKNEKPENVEKSDFLKVYIPSGRKELLKIPWLSDYVIRSLLIKSKNQSDKVAS